MKLDELTTVGMIREPKGSKDCTKSYSSEYTSKMRRSMQRELSSSSLCHQGNMPLIESDASEFGVEENYKNMSAFLSLSIKEGR